MSPSSTPFAIWLLPSGDCRRHLEQLIASLARRHRTPPFPPHLTLLGGLEGPDPTVRATLARAAKETPPFELIVQGVVHSDRFFETLYLRFAPAPELDRLRRRLVERLSPATPRLPHPHLSLLYAELASDRRQALCDELEVAAEVELGELALSAPAAGSSDWRQVEGWRLLARWALSGVESPAP